jgi:23S rRNA (guanosine2251-2'-O)-methyltransferase
LKNEHLIYGLRPVIEALRAGKEIDRIFIHKGLSGDLFRELRQMLAQREIHFQYVPSEKLDRLVRGTHQGVVAFISQVIYQNIEDLLPGIYEKGKVPFIIILDRITDVRNMGAIARTAECAGADAIVVPEKDSAQMNADAVKTSAGALNRLPVCRVQSLKNTVEILKQSGLQIIAVSEKGAEGHTSPDLTVPLCLIMGSEEDGIGLPLLKAADCIVRLPMMGEIGSLNVSVAAGVMMYEVVRQRTM